MPYNHYKSKSIITGGDRLEDLKFLSPGIVDMDMKMRDNNPRHTIDHTGVGAALDALNSAEGHNHQAVLTAIQNVEPNAKIWAIPSKLLGFAESLSAHTGATGGLLNSGTFDKGLFDDPGTYPIAPSNFPGLTSGCLWYCVSLFTSTVSGVNSAHVGDIYINHRQEKATGSNGLSSLFSPVMVRPTEGFAVYGQYSGDANADAGHTQSYTSYKSGTMFSSNQAAGPNGYHSSSKFSNNDGVWGFREDQVLDASGLLGSSLSGNSIQQLMPPSSTYGADCYGIQNYRSADSTVNDIYWASNNPIYNDDNWRAYIWSVFE